MQVIDKTISEDIANFYHFKTANLRHFKKLLAFLASIAPGTMNVHNLSQHLSIDGKTVMHYLQSLQETGLITLIYPAEGGNQGLRRPEKMFLNNTNLHYAINGEINTAIDIGSVRELFFIQAVSNTGEKVFYAKQGDYAVANHVFEIGGRNKARRQIKGLDNSFVVKDDSLVSRQREIPLVLFGFLY